MQCVAFSMEPPNSPRNLFCAPHAPLSVSVSVSVLLFLLLLLSPPVALLDFSTLTSTGRAGWLAPDLGLVMGSGSDGRLESRSGVGVGVCVYV